MKKLLLAILLVSQLAIYGQQKVYTDRTELEGVELPGSGQTRMLVIDENKKIKSEPKPDLSNFVESDELGDVAFSNSYNDLDDKPTIPDQVNLIEGSNITITGTYPNLTISASGTVGTNWNDIGGDQSDVNISGFTNDAGYITEVTEGDVTQYESSLTITESQISDLGDYLESGDNISELVNDVGYLTEADLPPSELQDLQSVMEQGSIAILTNPTEPLPEGVGFLFLGEEGIIQDYSSVTAGNFTSNKQVSAKVDNGETEGQVTAELRSVMYGSTFTSEQTLSLRATKGPSTQQESTFRQQISDFGASGFQLINTSEDGYSVMSIESHTETGMVVRDDVLETGLKYASDYSENGETDDLWIPSWGAVKEYVDSVTPPQLNPTAGTGISITGTYPNLTFTNTSPNVAQDLDSVLGQGDVTDKEAKFIDSDSTNYSYINGNRVISGDIEKGSYTKIDYNGIDMLPKEYAGVHLVRFNAEGNEEDEFVHNFPAKSGTIAHTSDLQGRYIDVVLDKGEINGLHTTPVTITSTDLGLAVGQYAKIMINSCEVKVNSDGVDFSSTRPIFLTYTTPTANAEILKFDYTNYSGANKDGYYSFTNAGSGFLSQSYRLANSYQLNVGEEITGGGVNATITFRIYYHIVDPW